MDNIFSYLPIIIFVYAIVTMFNPKNKAPRNQRQNRLPPQGTWKQKMEELERQMFPQEVARIPQTRQTEPTMRSGSEGSEGFGSEGYTSTEGTSGTEGTGGTEGTPGTEGTWGTEGTYGSEGSSGSKEISTFKDTLEPSPKAVRTKKPEQQENPMSLPRITEDSLMQGVIWAEVLGKPRARGGWSDSRR